jgi:hypothetical protein
MGVLDQYNAPRPAPDDAPGAGLLFTVDNRQDAGSYALAHALRLGLPRGRADDFVAVVGALTLLRVNQLADLVRVQTGTDRATVCVYFGLSPCPTGSAGWSRWTRPGGVTTSRYSAKVATCMRWRRSDR